MKIPIKPFVKISAMWTCCHSYPDDCWYLQTLFRSYLRNFIIYIRMAIFWGQFSVHSMTIYTIALKIPIKPFVKISAMWTCCHSYPDDCWYLQTLFRSYLRNFIIYIRMAIFWGQFSVHSMTIYYSFPLKAILRLNQWLEFFIDKNKWLLKVQVGIVHKFTGLCGDFRRLCLFLLLPHTL